jgi:hypothetical protein
MKGRIMNSLSQLKTIQSILVAFALSCFALLPKAPAAPETALAGFNTADGDHALFSITTGIANTAVGWFSLKSDTDGSFNTAIGAGTLLSNTANQNTATGAGALLSNTTGFLNTANGAFALFNNITGNSNTAIGHQALFSNTTGGDNTAVGDEALIHNTEGIENTAVGSVALVFNTAGNFNTANGFDALFSNSTGSSNTATGVDALLGNTTGSENTAVGVRALKSNTAGDGNTATGRDALGSNTEGDSNTANGISALLDNTTGNNNTANGADALRRNTTGGFNTANGNSALGFNTTGAQNTAVGFNAGTGVSTASNVICIGASVPGANVDDSCFIGNIRDALVAPDAAPVLIDSAGKLGTTSGSSRRFKKKIQPMDSASEVILSLKPVTFHYKTDKANMPQFGLIAEEVAKVNRDLVVRDKNGELLTVRYDAVNAMLLNEFLKEHKKVEEQQASIAQLKSTVAKQEGVFAQQQKDFRSAIAQQQKRMEVLTTQLTEQAGQIQKVSAEIQITRPELKTVLNNQ